MKSCCCRRFTQTPSVLGSRQLCARGVCGSGNTAVTTLLIQNQHSVNLWRTFNHAAPPHTDWNWSLSLCCHTCSFQIKVRSCLLVSAPNSRLFFFKWQPTFSNGSKDAIWAAVYARRDLPCLWIPGCRSAGPPPQCSPSSDSCVDDSSDQLFTPEIRRRLPGTKAVALRQSKGSKLLPHALPGLRVRVIVRLLRSCRVVSIQEALISHSSLLLPVTSTHHVAF